MSPTTIAKGSTFTITQTVTNQTSETYTSARANIYASTENGKYLPKITELISCTGDVTGPCETFGAAYGYHVAVGALPPGESRTVVYMFRMNTDAPTGALKLRHKLDPERDYQDGPPITIIDVAPDIAVSLEAVSRGVLSSTVDYTITATNTGDGDAKSATVTATYPDGMALGSSPDCTESTGPRELTCSVGALPAGATTTLRFTAHPELLNLGSLTATARLVSSAPVDPNPANNTASRSCTAITGLIIVC
ncbi:DUF11 domain-containing protein [Amycolatopsis sp. BJA-103]|uniref:DUF11 domain-containing protein n=1 Tax=Amycolatopsis sp. BJA-103 TaxID=1911175 RepID=UPI0011AECEF2|nr:DUF11 domain-containing protein [Amycolatopsis sp. BJA-103]